jgi:hypothetical protein
MAAPTSVSGTYTQQDGSVRIFQWVLTTADPTGLAVCLPEWADRTWSVSVGAAGAATLKLEGSNTNVTADFATMHDAAVPATSSWASGPQCVNTVENPVFVRPNLTTPGAGATWTITLCARRASPIKTN